MIKSVSQVDHIAGSTTLFLFAIETKNQAGHSSHGDLQHNGGPANVVYREASKQ